MFFRKLLSNGTISCSSQASRPPPSYRFGHFNGFGSSFRFLLKLRQLPQSSIRSRVGHYEYRLRNQRTGTFPSPSQAKTAVVIQCGALPILLRLIESPDVGVREQASWALGNIAGDNAQSRDDIINAGGVELILKQLNKVRLVARLSPTGRLHVLLPEERRVAAVESVPHARRPADGLRAREDLPAVHAADAAGQPGGRGDRRLLVLRVHHRLQQAQHGGRRRERG